ncbi:IS1380 family transposase, partial [Glutamicibacter sp. HZAU]
TLFDTDGNRVTAFLTNSPRFNVAFLDARHRARGRCENRVKTLKSTGLGKLPYWSFTANQAWADLAMFAVNLVSWLQ